MFRARLTRCDIVASVAVLLAAILMLLLPPLIRTDAEILVITTPEGSAEYALSQPCSLTVISRGITLTVVIEDGGAYVLHSDCPDGVCRLSGRIRKSGETIVCAPAGIRLLVKGGDEDVDFVAG